MLVGLCLISTDPLFFWQRDVYKSLCLNVCIAPQFLTSAVLPPGKSPRYLPTVYDVGWAPVPFRTLWSESLLPGIETLAVQPVARLYTELSRLRDSDVECNLKLLAHGHYELNRY
jgi:hypothetical protein